jgi:hypothetical protein
LVPALLEQNVDAAETLGGGAQNFRAAVVPGDVGGDAVETLAGAAILGGVLGFLERRSIEFDGDNAGAGVKQPERHHPAEAAPGAGHNGDFSVKCSGRCSGHGQPPVCDTIIDARG